MVVQGCDKVVTTLPEGCPDPGIVAPASRFLVTLTCNIHIIYVRFLEPPLLLFAILQPQWGDLRHGSLCTWWRFTSEPDSSGARVSLTAHVLHILRGVLWHYSAHLWSHTFLTYDDGSDENSSLVTMQNCKSIYHPTLSFLVFYCFSLTKYICEDFLNLLPFFVLWDIL